MILSEGDSDKKLKIYFLTFTKSGKKKKSQIFTFGCWVTVHKVSAPQPKVLR